MSREQSRNTGINRRKNILMHRLIMVLDGKLVDIDDNREIDHINRVRTDNRSSNLRVCEINSSTNAINSGIRIDNTSGYKGVAIHKGKWCARVQYRGKRLWVGYFNTKEDAAIAYNNKALQLFGEKACLNVIGEKEPAA